MEDVLRGIQLLHGDGDVVEIRSFSPKPVVSGYFKVGSSNIAKELDRFPGRTFYQTMNKIDEACYARGQHEHLVSSPTATTADGDVKAYRWILIDADPIRPAGISSTDSEKDEALAVIRKVYITLKRKGFKEPVVADSGNGYHLLYRIQAQPDCKDGIARFLKVMDIWFSNEHVQIDTSVYNPARITKLYGTMATKGASTEERPHRMSSLMRVPDQIERTPWDLIQLVADEYPQERPDAHSYGLNEGSSFDVAAFLQQHGVETNKVINKDGYTKYVLQECPFDPSHKAPDAAVFQYAGGRLGFKCFHNSCSGYSWHDFRKKVAPESIYSATISRPMQPMQTDATEYDDDELDEIISQDAESTSPAVDTKDPIMWNITDIPDEKPEATQIVKSRLVKMDKLIGGFNKGELSVWSGGNGSGKTSLINQIGLSAVHQGYKVAVFSGEMSAGRLKTWIYLQAAGHKYVEPDPYNGVQYRLKLGVRSKIEKALNGKMAIYNNDYSNDWEQVTAAMATWVQENKADVMIVDNLMALGFKTTQSMDKYDVQSHIAGTLKEIAKNLGVHVHFICHPRKTEGFLRKNDISGSADLTNIADNVFMVHRVNADFRCQVKLIHPQLIVAEDVGNAIEIMKNRSAGVVDEMILLYFDKTCKIMSDVKGGVPEFAWEEKLEQVSMSNDVLNGFIPIPPEEDVDNPFL